MRAMTLSEMTVALLMTSPVVSIRPATPLETAYRVLLDRRISAVPVVAADGRPLGVLSETDLLHIGRLQPRSLAGLQVLELPAEPVGQHMHPGIITVREDTPVTAAAGLLAEQHIHRAYVADESGLTGVFSIEEVLVAIRERRIETPVGDVMTAPVHTVFLRDTVAEATARLDHTGVSGLAVVDEAGHPAGIFTRTEALRAREIPADSLVEEVMSYSMLHHHLRTPVFRAAAHAYETGTRRVLVVEDGELAGVLSGLDFARVLASADAVAEAGARR
jgi:CBS domain-containing protein